MKLLSRKDWANDVKQAVNAFIIDNYNNTNLKKDYVIFDFDNTCSIFDCEETTLKYQLLVMALSKYILYYFTFVIYTIS